MPPPSTHSKPRETINSSASGQRESTIFVFSIYSVLRYPRNFRPQKHIITDEQKPSGTMGSGVLVLCCKSLFLSKRVNFTAFRTKPGEKEGFVTQTKLIVLCYFLLLGGPTNTYIFHNIPHNDKHN